TVGRIVGHGVGRTHGVVIEWRGNAGRRRAVRKRLVVIPPVGLPGPVRVLATGHMHRHHDGEVARLYWAVWLTAAGALCFVSGQGEIEKFIHAYKAARGFAVRAIWDCL